MEKKYIVRPLEILIELDEIEDWKYPNPESELFSYDLIYQTLEEYNRLNKVLNYKTEK